MCSTAKSLHKPGFSVGLVTFKDIFYLLARICKASGIQVLEVYIVLVTLFITPHRHGILVPRTPTGGLRRLIMFTNRRGHLDVGHGKPFES